MGEGWAEVEYWWVQEGNLHYGGHTQFALAAGQQVYCVDLGRRGFAEATGGAIQWGGPSGRIARLRLGLPAAPGQPVRLDWLCLGPNYDLRAAPSEELPPAQPEANPEQ